VQQHTTIAVDLAESVFELAISERPGTVSLRRRLTRGQFSSFVAELPAAPGSACPGRTSPHRLRSSWVATRTARLNTLRGLLRELGISLTVGATRVVPAVRALCEQGDPVLPEPLRASAPVVTSRATSA
jgi:hypothetical protein